MKEWSNATPDSRLAEDRVILAATDLLHRALADSRMSRHGLARRLNLSTSEVGHRLNDKRNFTLRSLARMLYALGYDLEITMRKRADAGTRRLVRGDWP